jgi:hypothetical protein
MTPWHRQKGHRSRCQWHSCLLLYQYLSKTEDKYTMIKYFTHKPQKKLGQYELRGQIGRKRAERASPSRDTHISSLILQWRYLRTAPKHDTRLHIRWQTRALLCNMKACFGKIASLRGDVTVNMNCNWGRSFGWIGVACPVGGGRSRCGCKELRRVTELMHTSQFPAWP